VIHIWIAKAAADDGSAVWLTDYVAKTEREVREMVLHDAWLEGYHGELDARLKELGWEVVRVTIEEVTK